jgi:hypothetical protein
MVTLPQREECVDPDQLIEGRMGPSANVDVEIKTKILPLETEDSKDGV